MFMHKRNEQLAMGKFSWGKWKSRMRASVNTKQEVVETSMDM